MLILRFIVQNKNKGKKVMICLLDSGFDRDRGGTRDELACNKNIKGKCHLGIMLKDVFGFAEHQENATYGLGYK